MSKIWLVSGAVFAFLSVAIGAFGAHGLRNVLDEYGRGIYQTAVQYQMFHSLALIALGLIQNQWKISALDVSGWSFIAGILIFSGSLYIIAVTGFKPLGAVTPVGGLAFLFGWFWLIFQVLKFRQ
jgi:uncharacterized membrane protein YgdD (TMEM256/DUF423 family)